MKIKHLLLLVLQVYAIYFTYQLWFEVDLAGWNLFFSAFIILVIDTFAFIVTVFVLFESGKLDDFWESVMDILNIKIWIFKK